MNDNADDNYSNRFFEQINILKKQFRCAHTTGDVYSREMMMLNMIDYLNKEKKNENAEEDGVKAGELVAHMHVTKSAISKMLNILEEKGYIERVTNKQDRRNVYVILSKEGEDEVKKLREKGQAFTMAVVDELGSKDSEELIRILTRLNTIIEKKTKEIKYIEEENHA